jgi:hypothetical protein
MLVGSMSDFLAEPGVAIRTCLTFMLVVAPVYLVFRFFVKLVRQAYGFDPPPPEDGPPLRICAGCHNTVLEADFTHCPYCGAVLAPQPGDDAD